MGIAVSLELSAFDRVREDRCSEANNPANEPAKRRIFVRHSRNRGLTFLISYCTLTNMNKYPNTKRVRMSSEERREMVLDAAVAEFAHYGLYRTTTEAIAGRVGITQPYIFRLFRNKKELFLAAVERAYGRIMETWESVLEEEGDGASAEQRLLAMGRAYAQLMDSREELLLLLQTFAASEDPDVLRMNRENMARMHDYVTRSTGAGGEQVQGFFAQGMLLAAAAGLNLPEIADQEPWAREFMGTDKPWSDSYPETPP